MPGKVNPVIPEVVNQIAFQVIGNDVTVTFAAEAGQLQLNAFEPIIAYSLFKSLATMERGCRVLAEKCVDGITANEGRLRELVDNSMALVTALSPRIGYAAATKLALEAHASGKRIRDLALEQALLPRDELDRLLDPAPRAELPE
jgi:aspartate ammonia-lyase